jgi:hypothetical protein
MSADRSRERRQLAGDRLIFAKQMTDWKIRASVLGMTQRWLDLAELHDDDDALDKAVRLRAVQAKIGHELRAQYELPKELPHRILTLLMQLNAQQDAESGATVANGQSATS